MVTRIALLLGALLIVLWLVAGCAATPDVHKAWSECLAFGGSAKFIATESTRQAECTRSAPGAEMPNTHSR